MPGTFKAPYFPILPILGVITCLILVPTLDLFALQLGGILSIVGVIIFLMYSWNKNKEHIEEVNGKVLEKQADSVGGCGESVPVQEDSLKPQE